LKVAISTDGNFVSVHFGRCPSFTIIEIENNQVISKEVIDNPGHHPGFLPQFLHQKGVGVIVSGGMGPRAQTLFSEAGIKTMMGISGEIEQAIKQITSETLESGESLCQPGAGKGYGVEKTACDHPNEDNCEHE